MGKSDRERVGVWLVGARGNVALLSVVGAAALRAGLIDTSGLVSAAEDFRPLALVDPGRFVFGGHDLTSQPLEEAAADFQRRSGILQEDLLRRVRPALRQAEEHLRPGFTLTDPEIDRGRARGVSTGTRVSPAGLVDRVVKDLESFRAAHRLERVVVVHVASTEGPAAESVQQSDLKRFRRRLGGKTATGLTASLIYAYAAIEAGCPWINFTPSPGAELPAIAEWAQVQGVAVAGNDGKTGETLVKTVLAPLFVARNLRLRTWYGYNLLGNRDGESLADPGRRVSKLRTKDRALTHLVKEPGLASRVTIDFAESLHDWKTAWDYIQFDGFLGARMNLQFCWQGSDSALAAPLVLDLVRFAELSQRRGETGPLPHLASFFKSPLAVDDQNFHRQFELLLHYARRVAC